ncbi:UxaA family hydrolase [Priestia endophytica]|jgi:altronate dehydratase large subunit|uniref:UxaA family hydrolase n=1 Tax=Priestia endophytica TaxID=135735 RepID=UPI000F53FF5F|nr:UxaA family hydrolase [Priestia endophytica]RPK10882.1 Altronate hydrolase [Priestia endophytica]
MSYSFKGFARNDGTVGIRNYIGVVSSVVCSSVITKEIADKVPAAIPITHTNGCAQLGDDFQLTKNTLLGVSANPNLHSTLFIGLGCETNQVSGLLESAIKTKPIEGIGIQQLAGGRNTVTKGKTIVEEWAKEVEEEKRVEVPLSFLTVGILAIDIDEESLTKVTPVIGSVVDTLVDHKATVIVGMSKSLEPAGTLLSKRAISEKLQQRLQEAGEGLKRRRWKEITNISSGCDEFSPSEKSYATVEAHLTGSKPIYNWLGYTEQPNQKGLHLLTVPSNLVEALSNMAASGCNMVMIVSNRGLLASSIALPCMMITPQNSHVPFDELTDYTISENMNVNHVEKVLDMMIDICSGKQTSLEKFGLGEFAIPHIGTTF